METGQQGEASRFAQYDREGVRLYLDPARFSPGGDAADTRVQALLGLGYSAFEEAAAGGTVEAFAERGVVSRGEVERFLRGVEGILRWDFFLEEGKDWNAEWERNYDPLVVEALGRRVAILAPFHDAIPGTDLELRVSPRMAFGTGHHATTHLMLEAILEEGVTGLTCLDMGTGTGILAIAARRLGAARVVAIDNDPVAVVNARENAGLNGVDIELLQGDFGSLAPFEGLVDRVFCNITRGVLVRYAPALARLLRPGGLGSILLSGFHPEDCAELECAFSLEHLRLELRREREGWSLLCLRAAQ